MPPRFVNQAMAEAIERVWQQKVKKINDLKSKINFQKEKITESIKKFDKNLKEHVCTNIAILRNASNEGELIWEYEAAARNYLQTL